MEGLISSQLFVSLHVMAIVVHVILIGVAYSIYLERKISAYIQDRVGPNRVGFDFGLLWLKSFFTLPGIRLLHLDRALGLGQPLADGIKFMLKEDYRPTNVDKVLFTLAPIIVVSPALIGFMIIPWGGVWDMPLFDLPLVGKIGGEHVHIAGANINIGVIYLLAVGSLSVYGVTLGGWASNNKYSFLGGLRCTAQMISYEIPMGMALLAVVLAVGSFMPEELIRRQTESGWLIFSMPLAAILFFVCALAEANRAPFDNAEAEQELVGGYHTEYSSMRFALFFLAEYSHMITSSAFFALLFLGGWSLNPLGVGPHMEPVAGSFLLVLAKFGVYFAKVILLVCFMMVIRWTLPRMRYDQIMMLGWHALIPLALTLIIVMSFMRQWGLTEWWMLLGANVGLIAVAMLLQPVLQRTLGNPTENHKIPLYGSRFSPVPGTVVNTAPTDPMALEDRPVQGTVSTA
ncbi:MAG: NADH-quinone oxidoreductase subunit H [Phycisphaerales bacterium JB059]